MCMQIIKLINMEICTVYRKDYTQKSIKSLKQVCAKNKLKNKEFTDPISESFKNYLALESSADGPLEEANSYFERAKCSYPWLGQITNNKSIDKNVIGKNQIYNGRTVYQVDYSDLEAECTYKEKIRRNAVILPSNSDIALTTQRASYKDPIKLDSKVYEQKSVHIIENNLNPNEKIRKILNVTTGDSEYMSYISKLGKKIIVNQLHGVINFDI